MSCFSFFFILVFFRLRFCCMCSHWLLYTLPFWITHFVVSYFFGCESLPFGTCLVFVPCTYLEFSCEVFKVYALLTSTWSCSLCLSVRSMVFCHALRWWPFYLCSLGSSCICSSFSGVLPVFVWVSSLSSAFWGKRIGGCTRFRLSRHGVYRLFVLGVKRASAWFSVVYQYLSVLFG